MTEKAPKKPKDDPPTLEERREDKVYESGINSMEQGNPFFPVSNILRAKRKAREAREANEARAKNKKK